MLAWSRWASNYYITPATVSSDQLERRCWNGNHVLAEAVPPGPRLSSPGEQERKAVIARRVGGSICCSSVQSPTHLSHNNTLRNPFEPFQIKWGNIFLRTESTSLLCWICICIWFCMYMCMYSWLWLYNKKSFVKGSKPLCLPKLFSFPNDTCIRKIRSRKVYP